MTTKMYVSKGYLIGQIKSNADTTLFMRKEPSMNKHSIDKRYLLLRYVQCLLIDTALKEDNGDHMMHTHLQHVLMWDAKID